MENREKPGANKTRLSRGEPKNTFRIKEKSFKRRKGRRLHGNNFLPVREQRESTMMGMLGKKSDGPRVWNSRRNETILGQDT